MRKHGVDQIRNLALIAHSGAGKTSLAEAMLFSAGVTDRLGRTDEGTSVLDYDPEEVRRRVSISTSMAPCPWKGHKVNLVDTPGYFDFVGEVLAALRVVDGALLLVDAVSGVEVGTELVAGYARGYGVPLFALVNKMDRENASFSKAVESLSRALKVRAVPVHLPIGVEASFRGMVELVAQKAFVYETDGSGRFKEGPVPQEMAAEAEAAREALIEAAAEGSDALIEKYLAEEPLTPEEIWEGLRRGMAAGKVLPVLCASALRNVGAQAVLDAILALCPSPAQAGPRQGKNPRDQSAETREPLDSAPFSALVFKTMADPYVGKLTLFRVYSGTLCSDSHVYNASRGRSERVGQLFALRGKQQEAVQEVGAGDLAAVAKLQETTTGDTLCDEARPVVFEPVQFPAPVYTVAVQPKAKGDEEKIGSGLARLAEEDPTFKVEKQPETGQILISGTGELHLEVMVDRLRRKFGVDTTIDAPKVPYRETIRGQVKVEGKHKKQTGGRGQYGHVFLELEPLPLGQQFEFVDKIFGGAVPRQYIPAVEKGVREAMQEGVLAGYPVTDVRVTLYDGSSHPVDSSELAFKIAASMAFKKGALQANPVILEPIMDVEVLVPEACMGDAIGDLNKKRGKILGMEPRGGFQAIRAQVPLAEMFRYAIDLRSITQGRGTHSMKFSHYEEVPSHIAQAIIERSGKGKESERED
ncbi:MAG: elongation factor G [Acetobacteraceae bacterium]|nr:elongation factor G [Acetobacteraceae bacterium]